MISNKNIDLVINDNKTFYFVDSDSTLNFQNTKEVLTKIEFIVKNNLNYDITHQDHYSILSKPDLYNVLKESSTQIYKRYSKLSWIYRKTFGGDKQILQLKTSICSFVNPTQALKLPAALIQEVANFLWMPSLGVLARLNRQGRIQANTALVRRAYSYGNEGTRQPIRYMSELFILLDEIVQKQGIPEKYLSYVQLSSGIKKLDREKTLQNLKNDIQTVQGLEELKKMVTTKELFAILSNSPFYWDSFAKIRKLFFSVAEDFNVTPIIWDGVFTPQEALVESIRHRNEYVLNLLLKHKADLNIATPRNETALSVAAYQGNEKIVELLVNHGADVDFTPYDDGRGIPLFLACRYGQIKVVKLLLLNGAEYGDGGEALHSAVLGGHAEIVKLFLDLGANINHRKHEFNRFGGAVGTPLTRAVWRNDIKSVKFLLEFGADPNILCQLRGRDGTALDFSNRVPEITSMLLEYNAKYSQDI